jgi:Protein of unknown function (DUF1566)
MRAGMSMLDRDDFRSALEAYHQWLNSDVVEFRWGDAVMRDTHGETEFVARKDCQKLADHGPAIRYALQVAFEAAAKAEQRPGDHMRDGTVFAGSLDGNDLFAMPADAPLTCTFSQAAEYVEHLNAQKFLGHDDWRVPTLGELKVLFNNRATIGGFNESSSYLAGWYWSSEERTDSGAWFQRFCDGGQNYGDKYNNLSLRLVR